MSPGDRAGNASLLATLPTRRMRRKLARCIPQLDFMGGEPPSYLFVSGRANRCNPPGVDCVYFSETEAVAGAEYRRHWQGTPGADQPRLTYFAVVDLARIIDLADEMTLGALDLTDEDMFGTWRGRSEPTRLQGIGLAISRQASISAIRYPSAAARSAGMPGFNVVVFRAAVCAPDSLEILGRSGDSLERWP